MSLLSLPVELIENIVDKASEVPSTRSLGLFLITTKQLHPFGVKCLYAAPDFQFVRDLAVTRKSNSGSSAMPYV
jgi:hypothetical protein